MVRKIGKTTLFATIAATVLLGNHFRPAVANGGQCVPPRLRHYVQRDRALRRSLHLLD